jgi:hypothetical protein
MVKIVPVKAGIASVGSAGFELSAAVMTVL